MPWAYFSQQLPPAALVQAAIAVFACHLYGLEITWSNILTIVVLGIFLSIGTAGVKGSAMVMTTVSLTTLGLPLTLIPILTAIWPLIDPTNTTLNITGDPVGTATVAKKMHLMDEEIFKIGEINLPSYIADSLSM